MRAQLHGHECRWFDRQRKDGSERRAGEGIIQKVRGYDELWSKWMGWADLIYIPGNNFYMDRLEAYRRLGYPIYGGNAQAAQWEIDRAEGQRVMKECGLKIIPGREFHDYESAIAHVRRTGQPLVSKPSGEADKALSYVSDSAADLVYMLERWSKNEKYVASAKEHGFILQEKKIGCEMGAGGWFGPGGWAPYWEEDWEYKKLMDGDLGVNTGEQGTLVRLVKQSKLADKVLKPLTEALRSIEYVGCVNVNCILDAEGTPWPLEFTMRDGWPARHNQVSLMEGDPAQFMLDLVNGVDSLKAQDGLVSVSVVIAIPPYPYSDYADKETEGLPIYGFDIKQHHLCEAKLANKVPVPAGDQVVEMPCYVTAGDYVAVVTGTGDSLNGASRSAYASVRRLKVCGSMIYRNDIGDIGEQVQRVQKHGFATGLLN